MKKQFVVSAVAGLLVLVLSAVAAEAQTANFQGSTLAFSHNGDFRDNGSSCPGGGSPTQYSWNFVEDGVTRLGNPVTHRFVSAFCAYTVKLTITCPGGSTATSTRFACFGCGIGGCIFPDSGYN